MSFLHRSTLLLGGWGGGGGATRMDFIYSFEVQFSHRTGGKKKASRQSAQQ